MDQIRMLTVRRPNVGVTPATSVEIQPPVRALAETVASGSCVKELANRGAALRKETVLKLLKESGIQCADLDMIFNDIVNILYYKIL